MSQFRNYICPVDGVDLEEDVIGPDIGDTWPRVMKSSGHAQAARADGRVRSAWNGGSSCRALDPAEPLLSAFAEEDTVVGRGDDAVSDDRFWVSAGLGHQPFGPSQTRRHCSPHTIVRWLHLKSFGAALSILASGFSTTLCVLGLA